MPKYRIYSADGTDFGEWEGDTPRAAWESMVDDSGRGVDADGNPTEGCFEDWSVEPVVYYATYTGHGGPISVRLVEEEGVARAMLADETLWCTWYDEARDDADDMLGLGTADMDDDDFSAAMEAAGYRVIAREPDDVALWALAD